MMRITSGRNLAYWASWGVVILALSFFVLWVLPRKGIGLDDEGYYLYATWAAITPGIPLDTLVPQAPFFILNAIPMLLGVTEYSHFRILFYFVITISIWIMIKGITCAGNDFQLTPLLILFGFFASFTTLLSYQNAPALFVMLSLGLLFLSLNAKDSIVSPFLKVLAGFMLAVAVFVNLTLLPAAFMAVLFLSLALRRKENISLFTIAFWATTIVSLLTYVSYIGISELLHSPSNLHTPQTFIHKLLTGPIIFLQLTFKLLGASFLMQRVVMFGGKRISMDQVAIISLPIITLFLLPLSNYNRTPLEIMGLNIETLMPWEAYGKVSFCFSILAIYLGATNLKNNRNALYSLVVLVVFIFIHSASSNLPFYSIVLFYSGGLFVLSFLIVLKTLNKFTENWKFLGWGAVFVCGAVIISFGIYYQLTFAFHSARPLEASVSIDAPKLHGLKTTMDAKLQIEEIVNGYNIQDCANKKFLALVDSPLLYYVFSKSAPWGSPFINPVNGLNYPERKLFAELTYSSGWCVFITHGSLNKDQWEPVRKLENYVQRENREAIKIGDYMLFVK